MNSLRHPTLSDRRIYFVVGIVADFNDESFLTDSRNLNSVLAWLHTEMPDTPLAILSTLRNDREVELARVAKASGVEIWSSCSVGVSENNGATSFVDRNYVSEAVENQIDEGDRNSAWLVGHCHLTLCFGRDGAGVANNAHDFRLHSVPASLGGQRGGFFAPETGASIFFKDAKAGLVSEVLDLIAHPSGRDNEGWRRQNSELNRLNREIAHFRGVISHRSASEVPITESSQRCAEVFQIVDTLSRQHQRNVTLMHSAMLALGLVVVLILQWMGGNVEHIQMADLYAVTFMCLGIGHMWVRRHSITDRYADYRVLAEGLRVQHAWHTAGISLAPSDFFLHKHHGRLAWVRDALKTFHLFAVRERGHATDCIEWVRHQADYHGESALKNGWLDAFFSKSVKGFYAVSGFFTVWMLCWGHQSDLADVVSATLGITASCGTLLLIFNGSMGFGIRAALHARMKSSFGLAVAILTRPDQEQEREEILVDLGREVIQETGEWIFVQGPP